MAARKLQSEIDRTLKKVAEGVELFESIYDKMQASTNMTQKEKLETDLKTQIKKLQRLRDQIKTWVASNDIKDKSQLLDNRKLIETQMEKFKACEKEMKTKAFSKEGLIQASKLDAKAQEKLEATQWLQSKVEELLLQVEQSEAEIETLQGGPKKKKQGAGAGRLDDLEHLNERRKWHISRLELVLRLLENGTLPVDKVNDLKEDVAYFVDSNAEENFDEDEGIYDELNLDEEEEKFGLVADVEDSGESSEDESEDIPTRTPAKKQEEDPPIHRKEEHSPILKKASIPQPFRKSSTVEAPKPAPPGPNFATQPMASIVKNGIPTRTPAVLPVRYATAAAAAVGAPAQASNPAAVTTSTQSATGTQTVTSPVNGSHPSTSLVSLSTQATQDQFSGVSSSPSLTHPSVSVPSPMLSSASASGQAADGSLQSRAQSPAFSEAVPPSSSGAPNSLSPQISTAVVTSAVETTSPVVSTNEVQQISQSVASHPQLQSQQAPALSPLPQQVQQFASSTAAAPLPNAVASGSSPMPSSVPAQQQVPIFPPGVKVAQNNAVEQAQGLSNQRLATPSPLAHQQQSFGAPSQPLRTAPGNVPAAFPGSLSDLVASFDLVKQKAPHRMTNLDQVHKLLDGSFSDMPQPQDTEKPKYYVPRNPYHTPPYYPQSPNPVLSSPALFAQLDIETLFYVFYYLPGTYQQFLAAKELKRQSWRFHVKYLTWFQRHSEPQAITEEYEQGVYVYFDWEGSWCQRKKSDFRFEYRYLSED